MCGIVGAFYKRGKNRDKLLARQMADCISHRGPDDDGFYDDGDIEFGFKRLSIIDLVTGHQPIFNEDHSKVIIFNGEIYNYLELRPELEKAGHRFTTNTDTEVILHLYEEKGTECLKELNGMFAIAIWDNVTKTLFIARDRLGIKPLYYYENEEIFIFASELKAILAALEPGEVSRVAIDDYLTLRYVPAPETMFEDICKLRPGYYILKNNSGCDKKKYWDMHFESKRGGRDDFIIKQFWDLFLDSVSIRLRSDVPLGVFLSGGVDSSAVIAAMSEVGIQNIKTFAIGFHDGPEFQEFKYAEMIAKDFHTEHHSMQIGYDDFFNELPRVIWHLDEPLADSATIPLYMISRKAKEHVTVILSGEGSDEIFAGYKKSYYEFYKKQIIKNLLRRVPSIFNNEAVLMISKSIHHDLYRFMRFMNRPVTDDDIFPMSLTMSEDEKRHLFSDEMRSQLSSHNTLNMFSEFQDNLNAGDYLDRKLYIDIKSWLPDDLLAKADRATMAHGLELRVPFLDYRLVEFGASLKNKHRIRYGESKYILKESLRGKIPKEIIYRKKMGFPVPIDRWFSKGNVGHQIAMKILLEKRTLKRGLFNQDNYTKLVSSAASPVYIWYLLVLELWFRIFIEKENPEKIRLML